MSTLSSPGMHEQAHQAEDLYWVNQIRRKIGQSNHSTQLTANMR
ncbi:MAG: hypothetical protein ACKVPZ_00165 [Burkholderiaceae bacterium]